GLRRRPGRAGPRPRGAAPGTPPPTRGGGRTLVQKTVLNVPARRPPRPPTPQVGTPGRPPEGQGPAPPRPPASPDPGRPAGRSGQTLPTLAPPDSASHLALGAPPWSSAARVPVLPGGTDAPRAPQVSPTDQCRGPARGRRPGRPARLPAPAAARHA